MKKIFVPTFTLGIGVQLIREYEVVQYQGDDGALAVAQDGTLQFISLKNTFENLDDAKVQYLKQIKDLLNQLENQWYPKNETPSADTSVS